MSTNPEFVSQGSPLVADGIVFPGVYHETEAGGVQAPEHRVERGFDFSTRVNAEPIEGTYEGWCSPSKFNELKRLREAQDPFSVTVGTTALSTAVLDNLEGEQEGETNGAYHVTLDIRQVQQGSASSAPMRADSSTGTQSSESTDGANPNITDTGGQSTSGGGGGGGGGGNGSGSASDFSSQASAAVNDALSGNSSNGSSDDDDSGGGGGS